MSISIQDRRRATDPDNAGTIDVANGTFIALYKIPGVASLFSSVDGSCTVMGEVNARKMADLVEEWDPPVGWAFWEKDPLMRQRQLEMKERIVDFLRECNGFRTY